MKCAWLLLGSVMVACGNVNSSPRDGGGNPDGLNEPDAPPPDAGEPDAWVQGPIEVTVKKTGIAQQNIDVLFSEADGIAVTKQDTDANGYARADLYPGGIVSILWSDAQGKHAAAFYDLRPGDHVVYDLDPNPPSTPNVGTVNIDFNTANKPAGATKYDVDLGCTRVEGMAVANSYSTMIDSDCVGTGSKVSVLVTAYNGTTFLSHGIAVDLIQSAGVWTAPITWQTTAGPAVNVALTNGPAHSVNLTVEATLERNGIRYQLGSKTGPGGIGSTLDATFPGPTGFAQITGAQYGVFWDMSAGPEGYSIIQHRSATALPDPFTRSLAATVLPRLNNVTLDVANTARPTIAWQADAALDADVLFIDVHQERVLVDDTDDRTWRLFLPVDYPSPVRLPAYGVDVSEYAPDASPIDQPRVFVIDVVGAVGFRAPEVLFGTLFANPQGANALETRFEFIGDK